MIGRVGFSGAGLLLAVTLVGAAFYGLWYVPSSHPDDERLAELARTLPVPAAYFEYVCLGYDLPDERKACEQSARYNGVSSEELYLQVPHAIPAEDCDWMARVLKEQSHEGDGDLYLNFNGDLNCDFASRGLKHEVYEPADGEYVVEQMYLPPKRVSREAYAHAYRDFYVTRPVYSLFRTRLRIEYGRHREGGSGYACTYNRFGGDWRREGECGMTWIS